MAILALFVLPLAGGIALATARTSADPAVAPSPSDDAARLLEGARRAEFTLSEACTIARQAVPGVVIAAELEVEEERDGLEIEYEIRILKNGIEHEVEVDAISGQVTEIEVESDGASEDTAAAPVATGQELHFNDVRTGTLPEGFGVEETYGVGQPARWQILEDPTGERGKYLALSETVNKGRTYNLLLSDSTFPANVEMSVLVRAESGVEDQGGGLMWRALDSENYYVTRWNPLEDNLRVYRVVAGDRQQLMSAKVSVDAKAWHEVSVSHHGDRIRIGFDGEVLLDLRDTTFQAAGRVGLWTKADAATSFDDLMVR